MGTTIVQIIALLIILILPFFIAKGRRKGQNTYYIKNELSTNYCVNERGHLEEMHKENIS